MPISTDDCKKLLSEDAALVALGAVDMGSWKRLGKKKTGQGIERCFAHACGAMAKVIEASGQIHIASTGSSAAELDDSAFQRAAPSPSSSAGHAQPRPVFWTREATSPAAVAAARALASRQFEWDGRSDGDLYKAAMALDPIAWANQFIFALCEDMTCICPKKFFEEEGYCYDQESPISHLLPPGSDDVNGCGSWELPFAGSGASHAIELMALGFHWDPSFQDYMDECSGYSGLQEMTPLLERLALDRSIPPAPGARSSPKAL